MLKTQAEMLHESGMQLMSKASRAHKVSEVIKLTELAMQVLAEAREVSSTITENNSIWSYIAGLVEGLKVREISMDKLYNGYHKFCSTQDYRPFAEHEFSIKIEEIFRVDEGQVMLLPEKLN